MKNNFAKNFKFLRTNKESRNYMNCIYKRKRSKNYKPYCYCTYYKKEIELNQCKNCIKKEYKEIKPIKSYKPIKKVSNKRVTVTKQVYECVYTRDKGKCVICGLKELIQLHHINGRGKDKTNDVNNCVMLCYNCHHNVVHKNNKYWRPKLNEYIKKRT